MTPQQEELLGIYLTAPLYVNNFYTNLLRQGPFTFSTIGDTISYDEVEEAVRDAEILPRNVEFTAPKQDGFVRKATTPDIIKDSQYVKDTDGLRMQPGQTKTVVNGKLVDKKSVTKAKKILKMRHNIASKTEKISAEMLFKQKYSPKLGKSLTFTKADTEAIDGSTIEDFTVFIDEQLTKYQEKNTVYPTFIGLGSKIYTKLLKLYKNVRNDIHNTSATSSDTSNGVVSVINIGGRFYTKLPECVDAKNDAIDISDLILFYHITAIVPGFVGLTNVENGQAFREETEVLIRQLSANEKTGESEILGESGYIPLPVNPKQIKFIKVSNIDKIEAEEPAA